jgi:hypothetical protein
VHFEIAHDFDAPLDAVELAVLSPDLPALFLRELDADPARVGAKIESVKTMEHKLEAGELRRVLRFQAASPLPVLKELFKERSVARDMMAWEETLLYSMAQHTAAWEVVPGEAYRRYFRAHGTYSLVEAGNGRTTRRVKGRVDIPVRMLGPIVERVALAEIRKTFDVEAETLRKLATL